MSHIDLPRPLESYFVVEESSGPDGERLFRITLPYRSLHTTEKRCREWRLSAGEAPERRRQEETTRFEQEVERWLQESRQMLVGDEPIPTLAPIEDGA